MVHNSYGRGRSGVTLFWGFAAGVTNLVARVWRSAWPEVPAVSISTRGLTLKHETTLDYAGPLMKRTKNQCPWRAPYVRAGKQL